jgi:hypothetical protein
MGSIVGFVLNAMIPDFLQRQMPCGSALCKDWLRSWVTQLRYR